jgi:dihydrofolate synthase/folylpolyglutamate synthase
MARQSAARYLAARTRFGMKFGLGTMRVLLRALGHPERQYKTLLVAGTNGKGSVVAYTDAMLRASGLHVGRYTSPHLVSVRERIVVDGRPIGAADFERSVATVRRTAERLVRAGEIPAHPTHFEALTVAAFEHFRHAAVDVAVLEVGMGGRLDATNVSQPLASAIVSIDLDHQKYLGDTLAAIAFEKAGVLRRGRPVVLGELPAEARKAIASRARERGARLVFAHDGATLRAIGDRVTIRTPRGDYPRLAPLPGAHQRENLLVAIRLLEAARAAGVAVDLASVPRGIAATEWPGRLQWIAGAPPLLLDGAHNPAGARALAAYLRTIGPFVLLFGAMADKDVAELGRILFPLARQLVLTRPRIDRAARPADVARTCEADGARLVPSVRRALAEAAALAGPKTPVVVAGSLYLVGEVLKVLSSSRKWATASGVSHSAGPM